jgi:hypothetical protein
MLEISFVLFLYLVALIFFVDREQGVIGFSRGFYINFILVCLAFLNREEFGSKSSKKDLFFQFSIFNFQFSIFTFSLWLAVYPSVTEGVSFSKLLGLFLVFGTLCYFVLLSKLVPLIEQQKQNVKIVFLMKLILRLIFFISVFLSLFHLMVGDWGIEIVPFDKL